jgi:hypothetical protein
MSKKQEFNMPIVQPPQSLNQPPLQSSPIKCDHQFVYLRSSREKDWFGERITYLKIDYFYCQKCLKYEEIRHSEERHERDNAPLWYKNT